MPRRAADQFGTPHLALFVAGLERKPFFALRTPGGRNQKGKATWERLRVAAHSGKKPFFGLRSFGEEGGGATKRVKQYGEGWEVKLVLQVFFSGLKKKPLFAFLYPKVEVGGGATRRGRQPGKG